MPMNFPDMKSLKCAANRHKFRQPNEGEDEKTFRNELANYVALIDFVESQEIRTGRGWDQWTQQENEDALRRRGILT